MVQKILILMYLLGTFEINDSTKKLIEFIGYGFTIYYFIIVSM